ncbi:hypothetical protein CR970_02750 [Candidatus Saccharibacteria bacterium]|nr:MAG: hypothetical protein CR970_02750 [Candidatus Saccharibacteria bacterium]
MSGRFGAILASLIIIFAGIFFVNKNQANAPVDSEGNPTTTENLTTNHIKGSDSASVTLVEYGDFQCPACSQYHITIEELLAQRSDDIQFQFVHFPISSIHPNAMAAHRAAEAAGMQDKFWEMHDMLYSNSPAWQRSTSASAVFEGYASQLGLNMDKYREDVASTAVNDIINADLDKGRKQKIQGTPTFFVNGKETAELPQTLDDFNRIIDAAIKDVESQ